MAEFAVFCANRAEQTLQKNATIAPLAGIEPVALIFRCSALGLKKNTCGSSS
jgi:hypothetical protein